MKAIEFLGDSLKRIRNFPEGAKQDCGCQPERVQRGEPPSDYRPMPFIGPGVEEIRVWEESGTFRVIYTACMEEAVYVLHAFQKKAEATPKKDIDPAVERYAALRERTRGEEHYERAI